MAAVISLRRRSKSRSSEGGHTGSWPRASRARALSERYGAFCRRLLKFSMASVRFGWLRLTFDEALCRWSKSRPSGVLHVAGMRLDLGLQLELPSKKLLIFIGEFIVSYRCPSGQLCLCQLVPLGSRMSSSGGSSLTPSRRFLDTATMSIKCDV